MGKMDSATVVDIFQLVQLGREPVETRVAQQVALIRWAESNAYDLEHDVKAANKVSQVTLHSGS